MSKRHPAGQATYRGDCTHMVGEVKGPRTYGGHVVAVEATYDPDQDITTVRFEATTTEDRTMKHPDGMVRLVDDEA